MEKMRRLIFGAAVTGLLFGAQNVSAEESAFADLKNVQFVFASGVGAWSTDLRIHEDGTFEGQFHDSDMGSTGPGYDHGTVYLSNFNGKFTEPVTIDAYTYSMEIEYMTTAETPDTEAIIDQIRYVYTTPYGMDDAEELLLYLPGKPIADVPEGYMGWARRVSMDAGQSSSLTDYGLYNVVPECGFVGFEAEADESDLDYSYDESAATGDLELLEEQTAVLYETLNQPDLTQADMEEIASELYDLWDEEINDIWKELKQSLDSDTMNALTNEELAWIEYKETAAAEEGAKYEGGSMQAAAEYLKAAEMTRKRVYELLKYKN